MLGLLISTRESNLLQPWLEYHKIRGLLSKCWPQSVFRRLLHLSKVCMIAELCMPLLHAQMPQPARLDTNRIFMVQGTARSHPGIIP